MPERRKKSSGASRPIIAKTTSLGSVTALPSASVEHDARRRDLASSLRAQQQPDRAVRVLALRLMLRADRGVDALRGRASRPATSASRVLLELADLVDVLGLGARELLLAVAEGDVRRRASASAIAVSSAESPPPTTSTFLPVYSFGVVEAVVDLVELLAGHAERAVVAAAADAR